MLETHSEWLMQNTGYVCNVEYKLCCVDGVCSRVDFCHVFKCLLGTFLLLFICGAGKECKCEESRFSDSLGFSLGFSLRVLSQGSQIFVDLPRSFQIFLDSRLGLQSVKDVCFALLPGEHRHCYRFLHALEKIRFFSQKTSICEARGFAARKNGKRIYMRKQRQRFKARQRKLCLLLLCLRPSY